MLPVPRAPVAFSPSRNASPIRRSALIRIRPQRQTAGASHRSHNPAEQARIVRLLVDRVDIGEHAADVRLRMDGLAGLVREIQARPESDRQAA